jgi:ABC-2 type transport system permease protein
MTRLGQVLQIARRDFLERAKSKSFLVTMAVIIGAILLAVPLVAFLSSEDEALGIGIAGEAPAELEADLEVQAGRLGIEIRTTRFGSVSEGEDALRSDRIDVLVVDGDEIVWREEISNRSAALVTAGIEEAARADVVAELGLSGEDVSRLLSPSDVSMRVLVEPDPNDTPRQVAAFIGMMLLYMSILIFGQFVAMGTVEEKQNRVVEIVVSRVKPSQLLIGKVLGIGLLGLVQLLVIGVAAVVAITLIDVDGVSLPAVALPIMGWVLFWYLLGYTFYSFMYAALGATVSRQEDLQGVIILPVVFILPGFFIAQLAVENPDLPLAKYGSFFPPWTPMVMPIRVAVGGAAPWEVAVGIAGVVAGIVFLVWLGSRVYAGALLNTGGKVKLREAWRSARS